MKISIYTLGCKLNQAESDEIKNELRKAGHVIVPFSKTFNIAIIRACAVTAGASQTTREMIRQAKRRGAYIIASGCLENRDLPEIDFIAETTGDILKKVNELSLTHKDIESENHDDESAERTRSFIKIQNGCNFNCAYCTIPFYRGKAVSETPNNIIKKIMNAERCGYQEIVLTGVNICQYQSGKIDLAKLLEKILKETKIERIRLGSLDPRLIKNELVNIFINPRMMPHWHLSLQSGSDSVLARMRRGYTTEKYFEIVNKLRSMNKLFSFTTDIIVGFPGETEKEFNETLKFVKKVGFSKVHVFPYSKRSNTLAEKMADQVQDKIKTERVKKLIHIADRISKTYSSKLKNKIKSVLFEYEKNGYWYGFTPEYVQVKYKSKNDLKNQIINIK